MKREVYQRGIPEAKYGIWNCQSKEFQFGISEDTPYACHCSASSENRQ